MFWLRRPPYLHWLAAALLVAAALWVEVAPNTGALHPFLTTDLAAGDALTPDTWEMRQVPGGLFTPVEPAGWASVDLGAGEPLLASTMSATSVPPGWLVVSAPLPSHALAGRRATAVVIPAGSEGNPVTVEAVVVSGPDDEAFGDGSGALAVAPADVAVVSVAASQGRLVVGVSSASR